MKKETIRKLVKSAMFAALCCVATLVVQVPIATGYLNVGEGMCLLSGLVLGPWYGMAAAASVPNNLLQAAIGIVLASGLYLALSRVPEVRKQLWAA